MSKEWAKFLDGVSISASNPQDNKSRTGVKITNAATVDSYVVRISLESKYLANSRTGQCIINS